jgi:hypothetical protein
MVRRFSLLFLNVQGESVATRGDNCSRYERSNGMQVAVVRRNKNKIKFDFLFSKANGFGGGAKSSVGERVVQ